MSTYFQKQFLSAKQAKKKIALLSEREKNVFLEKIAISLEESVEHILQENRKDIDMAEPSLMLDRLLLNKKRILAIAQAVRNTAMLPDEVGRIIDKVVRPNGLCISRVRVPLGVVGMIYESRPNVTVDAAVLALKSGNAIVLKGGKEALHSNRILVKIMRDALSSVGFSPEVIQFLDTSDRQATQELLHARGYVDVLIPRGGKGLITTVIENANIPVIETGASVVHTFVDDAVDIPEAINIVFNEKTKKVSVCNALDTLLVHEKKAEEFLPLLGKRFLQFSQGKNIPLVKIHADTKATSILSRTSYPSLVPLQENDLETEWLDYEMSIKVVKDLNEALSHIERYSLGHSESICSQSQEHIDRFLSEVDAACVYANASTVFSDGARFGLGAEIGISTQKMHVRGPFALQGLTSSKWVVRGDGQIV